jgi:hypothetical protein
VPSEWFVMKTVHWIVPHEAVAGSEPNTARGVLGPEAGLMPFGLSL